MRGVLKKDQVFSCLQQVKYGLKFDGGLPNFLVIGAQKCGTTSFFDYLFRHPDLSKPLLKEVHFFENELNFKKGVRWYRSFFPRRGITGEATPFMYHSAVPSRVSRILPGVKLIVVLRDPVKRAFSHYLHNKARGRESLDFRSALIAEKERTCVNALDLEQGNERSRNYRDYGYCSRGYYIDQILMWTNFFNKEDIEVVFFDDLVSDPVRVMAGVCKFLGVADFDFGDLPHSNKKLVSEVLSLSDRNYLKEFYEIKDGELSKYLGRELPWDSAA